MDTKDEAALRRQLRGHLRTVWVLIAVVGLNVAVSFLPLDRGLRTAIQVALAVLGAGLVLAVFMHLLTEKQSTLAILGCTAVFFVALMALPLVAAHSHPDLTEVHQQATVATTNHTSQHVP